MVNVLEQIPEITGVEHQYVQDIADRLEDEDAKKFLRIYATRRKDTQTILILTIIGFLGIAGIQRFVVGQIGMGILYLLTVGLCYIGTIIDLVNYKTLALDFNIRQAQEVAATFTLKPAE